MPTSIYEKRVVALAVEAAQGTHSAPAASTDAIPLLRSGSIAITPFRVDRPTIRLTMTDLPDIYPGKATVEIQFSFELHANSSYVAGAGVTTAMRPIFARVIQCSAYNFLSEGALVYAYDLTSISTSAPIRHREVLTGATTPGTGNLAVADTYGDDGALFVDHGSTPLAGSPFTGADSGSAATVGARNVTECFAWYPNSSASDGAGGGQRTCSLSVWTDGKLLRAKGAMGNIEFQFRHGDAVVCACTFRGVFVDYADAALPTAPNEAHKYPPTFLGSRMTLRRTTNVPGAGNMYGSDGAGAGTIRGALNQMNLRTGNEIVFHENSLDPNGVDYARVTGRAPSGNFNPDEVSEAEFSFVSRFVSGVPLRLRTWVIGPPSGSWLYDDPATQNQNGFDFISPGIAFTGMADQERDSIMVFDASFNLTGGDYDTTAFGEAPGNDNEFVIVHR